MPVKGNQSTLHNETIDQFHFATTQSVKGKGSSWDIHEQVEKANGRVTNHLLSLAG